MSKGARLRSGRQAADARIPSDVRKAIRKLVDSEVKAFMIKQDEKYKRGMDSIILWQLYDQFGFHRTTLWKFYLGVTERHMEMMEHYEVSGEDCLWICERFLQEKFGINLDEWEKEADRILGERNKTDDKEDDNK